MSPITSFILFSSLVLGLIGRLPHPIVATSSLVDQVCEHTHNKANCIESFDSNPESEGANLEQLGVIALKLAAHNATYTSLLIKELVNNETYQTLDPAIQQALSDCADKYIDVNQQVDDSIAALLGNARQDVLAWVNVAIIDVKSCEDELNESGSQYSVLTVKNAMLRQLCNNALAINKILAIK